MDRYIDRYTGEDRGWVREIEIGKLEGEIFGNI